MKILYIDLVKIVGEYQGDKKDMKLYMDNGGKGVDEKLQPGIGEMIDALNARGYEEGVDFIFIKDEEAAHTEGEWAKRIPGALKYMSKH